MKGNIEWGDMSFSSTMWARPMPVSKWIYSRKPHPEKQDSHIDRVENAPSDRFPGRLSYTTILVESQAQIVRWNTVLHASTRPTTLCWHSVGGGGAECEKKMGNKTLCLLFFITYIAIREVHTYIMILRFTADNNYMHNLQQREYYWRGGSNDRAVTVPFSWSDRFLDALFARLVSSFRLKQAL